MANFVGLYIKFKYPPSPSIRRSTLSHSYQLKPLVDQRICARLLQGIANTLRR